MAAVIGTRRIAGLSGALCVLLVALPDGSAMAGEFQIAACQADPLSYSTRAFQDFATRGMKVKRACDPEGYGRRGLITANIPDRGRVPRGSLALATITAPPGTRMTTFRWAGTIRRRDCKYAMQMWADAPDVRPIPIKNVRANRYCPRRPPRAQIAGYRSRTFNVSGATRIVQRVICVGDRERKSCSARGENYLRTYKATVGIADGLPPSVAIIPDTALAQGAWVGGLQPLNYTASDNVGVRGARAFIGGRQVGLHDRPCLVGASGAFIDRIPCPNGTGQIVVDTRNLADGSRSLVVQAEDAARNIAVSGVVTARIDNTPPARVDVGVEGGEEWRNRNDWAVAWTNPAEPDRAPIVAASYELCAADGQPCTRATNSGADVSRIALMVPSPGEWKLALWRGDAAGNETESNASVPVTLRYDPDPPQLAFQPSPASDPTLVHVQASDPLSGIVDASIEISRAGSGIWQMLATQPANGLLTARIDDATLPAGTYLLRARARDRAGNESSTDRRVDGQPMLATLPLRITTTLQAGLERTRMITRRIRHHGRRRKVRRPVTVLRSNPRVDYGEQVHMSGRLVMGDGRGLAGAQIQVLSRTETTPERLVGSLQTGADGTFRYVVTGSSTRTLRLVYAGSSIALPAQAQVAMRVPAETSARVRPRRVHNGQAVTFTGQMRALPVPAGGKLVEVQVKLSGHWQTFRTTRSDQAGRWASRYRFRRTRGVQRYQFRVQLPREAGYPFETGMTRVLTVRVSGP